MHLIPVILSGGAGTRLWPLSREHYPKQLLAPFGDYTLLQATVRRLHGLQLAGEEDAINVAPAVVVCNEDHRFLVAEQLRLAGEGPGNILLEPVGRNTAPAATLAALHIAEADPSAIMLIMPADHLIQDTPAFHRAVQTAGRLAKEGSVVTFGIVPTRAETGYGYIKLGSEIGPSSGEAVPSPTAPTVLSSDTSRLTPHVLEKFVEKPDVDTAQAYVASGDFLWNSGIFMLQAETWLEAIGRFHPDILAVCSQAHEAGRQDGDFYRVDPAVFANCQSDSIDYAVMEKLAAADASHPTCTVVPLDAGWSDVGAWSSLWDVLPQDPQGNILKGDVIAEDTHDSLLIAESRLLAAIGLHDVIAIETSDAILVAPRDRAQDVKRIVARLKADGRSEHQAHRRVYRPWGSYEGIDDGDRFQVKRITVKPGASLSLQMHHHRAEHWVVVRGTARVTRGDEVFLLSENQSTYIPIGVRHRLENPGTLPLDMIEVQSGAYLGEDDIVRFEDNYGRE